MSASCVVAFLCLLPAAAGAASEYVWEGFEREINWDFDGSSAATGRVLDEENRTEGKHGLKLLYKSVAAAGRAVYGHGENLDWSPYGALLLDIYVPKGQAGLKVGVVIQTTDRWLSHEAYTPPLAGGWNRDLRIDLKGSVFSSAASDFKPVGYLIGRDEVKRVGLNVYPGSATEGFVTVDRLRLERAGLVSVGDLTLNSTFELLGSGGRMDYLPPGMRIRSRDVTTLESFEGASYWTTGAGSVTIEPAWDHVSRGAAGLAVRFPASPDGFDLDLSTLAPRLAGTRQLRLDVYCDGPGASIAMTLTDQDWNTYTSNRAWLGHGWNTRIFDFTNQGAWNGTVIGPAILSGLTAVALNVSSRWPGRLVFDGLSTADVALRGAARPAGLMSLSWHPTPALEFVADGRVEDTVYGRSFGALHSAGAEGWLDAGRLRWDAGGFRTNLLWRKKITAMDQPLFLLVSPWNLGNEVAGAETSGRIAGTEVQALAASRIEYEQYDSRRPTGLGPEQVASLRLRHTLTEGTRVGLTQLTHLARYPGAVGDVPRERHTTGADIESRLGTEGRSVNLNAEGAISGGPAPREAAANAPRGDRFYAAGSVASELGRLTLGYQYQVFGYDFDGTFTSYGADWAGHNISGGLNLEGAPGFRWLASVPLYDRSLAKNLRLSWGLWTWGARSRIFNPQTGGLEPRSSQLEGNVGLGNDAEARPNFWMSVEPSLNTDQWYRTRDLEENLNLRIPLVWDFIATSRGGLETSHELDRTTLESGRGWKRKFDAGLERYFRGNLYLHGEVKWRITRKAWEGVWADPESHAKITAGARQSLGPNSFLQVDFGLPALAGEDFGVQDTLQVVTVLFKTYI